MPQRLIAILAFLKSATQASQSQFAARAFGHALKSYLAEIKFDFEIEVGFVLFL